METKEKGFARLELLFENMTEANRCLNDKEGKEKKIVDLSIPIIIFHVRIIFYVKA